MSYFSLCILMQLNVICRHVVKLLCTIELSFYISGFFLLFFEVSRKDQVMMGVHHVVTVGLIGLCLYGNFTRVGSVVLLLHDFNDVVLEMGKISSYLNRTRLANCFLVLFGVCWFTLRIVAFPALILKNTIFEYLVAIGDKYIFMSSLEIAEDDLLLACPCDVMQFHTFVGPTLAMEKYRSFYYSANGLLVILYCMHIYWFGFIMEAAWR